MPEQGEPVPGVGISREQVAHLARLSRLALADAELDALAAELDVILSAVAAIGEVSDAVDVPPTTHAVPLENVTRPDVVRPSLRRETVLAGAPEAEDGRFRVPRILEPDSTVEPDSASPDSASPDSASPDSASPDSASPDSASPDSASPDSDPAA